MKKTILSLFILLFSCQAIQAQQVSYNSHGTTIHYRILSTIEKTVAVTFGTKFGGYTGDVVIPQTIPYNNDTYTVTKIDMYAFYNCAKMVSIKLPHTIISIGEYAFYSCGNLTTIQLPDGISVIENSTFANCKNLATIHLPNHLTTIKQGAFENCKSLAAILIPESVTTVDESAFNKCNNLTFSNSEQGKPTAKDCNISVKPNKIIAGTVTGSGIYKSGDSATIKALAYEGYKFLKWNDGDTNNPHSMIVTQDSSFIAYFTKSSVKPILYNLSLQINSSFMGRLVGDGDYPNGEAIEIRAIPNKGYQFMEWHDGNKENPRTITLTHDTLLMGIFDKQQEDFEETPRPHPTTKDQPHHITLTVNNEMMGNIIGGGSYKDGEIIQIAAIPNKSFLFEKWHDGNTENPRTIKVTHDSLFMAKFVSTMQSFVPIAHTITVISTDTTMGKTLGKGIYRKGSNIRIAAVANDSCIFAQWNDGNTENPRNIVLLSDTLFKANFIRITHRPRVLESEPIAKHSTANTKEVATENFDTYKESATALDMAKPPTLMIETVADEMEPPTEEQSEPKQAETIIESNTQKEKTLDIKNENITIEIPPVKEERPTIESTPTESKAVEEEFNLEVEYDSYEDLVIIGAKEVQSVKVYNSVHKKIAHYEGQNKISFSSFPQGQYLLLVTVPEGKFIRRVVKE